MALIQFVVIFVVILVALVAAGLFVWVPGIQRQHGEDRRRPAVFGVGLLIVLLGGSLWLNEHLHLVALEALTAAAFVGLILAGYWTWVIAIILVPGGGFGNW